MDTIIDTFYNDSLYKYKPRLTNNKSSTPNLFENRLYKTNLNDGFQINKRANPIPKTNYSMGLHVPTIRGHPPTNNSIAIPYPNPTRSYSTIRKNLEPESIKFHILNDRIKNLEDQLRVHRFIEENNTFNKTYMNLSRLYNPQSLDQALNNLRNPYLGMEEIAQKQALRRDLVQHELDKARDRINYDRMLKREIEKSMNKKNDLINMIESHSDENNENNGPYNRQENIINDIIDMDKREKKRKKKKLKKKKIKTKNEKV